MQLEPPDRTKGRGEINCIKHEPYARTTSSYRESIDGLGGGAMEHRGPSTEEATMVCHNTKSNRAMRHHATSKMELAAAEQLRLQLYGACHVMRGSRSGMRHACRNLCMSVLARISPHGMSRRVVTELHVTCVRNSYWMHQHTVRVQATAKDYSRLDVEMRCWTDA